ncbi:MAG: prephenate dehydrogenase/arogenate dehydrogenase family protein, partial [Erythrobacter sp.]|nr:prephenate dehydrogenase/arogenate dehydrogenase family protein [Erythrobacter sp.]
MTIKRVAIIGLGLLGGSIGLAVQARGLDIATTGWDRDPQVRAKAAERGLVGRVCGTAAEAVANADLVILCVPVGAMDDAARELAPGLSPHAI